MLSQEKGVRTMLKDITLGQYLHGNSLLHRMDPRTKLNGVLFFMIALFVMDDMLTFGIMVVATLTVIFISRIPWKFFWRGIKPLLFIVVLTVVLQMFMVPGEVLWQWKMFHITKEGLRQALFMGSRLILLVSITSILTLTTTPIVLTNGIEAMLQPFKKIGVPAHELAMIMTIALRFVPTLVEETDKIMKAQASRGADFESGNLIERVKALLPILVPLFLSALKRAEELAMAMEARGYHGGEGRTSLRELKFSKLDAIGLIVPILLFAGVLYLRIRY